MSGKVKLGLGMSVIALAVLFLVASAISMGTTPYYSEVDEVLSAGLQTSGKTVRVSGDLVPGSVEENIAAASLRFALAGTSGQQLTVEYQGLRPDNMEQATGAIVEGHLTEDGRLVASKIMMQCPSKYEAEDPQA
jgi:cytochrome c-type biogenesis protein CcmE